MRALLLAGCIWASGATAQPVAVQLDADEITDLLTDNTAIGEWDGVPYRQYFGEDGVTLYAQPDLRTTRGEWRVDPETDEYQSRWPGDAEWESWIVMVWMDEYYWLSRSTPPTLFAVVEGQELLAE